MRSTTSGRQARITAQRFVAAETQNTQQSELGCCHHHHDRKPCDPQIDFPELKVKDCGCRTAIYTKKPECVLPPNQSTASYVTRAWSAVSQQEKDIEAIKSKNWAQLEGTYPADIQPVVGAHKAFEHDADGRLTDSGNATSAANAGLSNYKKFVCGLMDGDILAIEAVNGYNGNAIASVGPMSALSSVPIGGSSTSVDVPDAYKEFSDKHAAELVENYCRNICLDVPFINYETEFTVNGSALKNSRNALDSIPADVWPLNPAGSNQPQTADTIFRGNYVNNARGPYISQLLLADINAGEMVDATFTSWNRKQQYRSPNPLSSLTQADKGAISWAFTKGQAASFLNNFTTEQYNGGGATTALAAKDTSLRYLNSGRSLGALVQDEPRSQLPYDISLILANWGVGFNPTLPSNSTNSANAYRNISDADINRHPSVAQMLSVMFTNMAHTMIYNHKYMTNRRIRPEAAGIYVHDTLTGHISYPFPSWFAQPAPDTSIETLWDEVAADNKAYMDVYPNSANLSPPASVSSYTYHVQRRAGCPRHPSYPAGHNAVAAGITGLKFIYNQNTKLSELGNGQLFKIKKVKDDQGVDHLAVDTRLADPEDLVFSPSGANEWDTATDYFYFVPSAEGDKLVVKKMTPDLVANWTIGDELNKAIANITEGRAWLGVHYRSDDTVGVLFAEQIAIKMFPDLLAGWYHANKVKQPNGSFKLEAPAVTIKTYQGQSVTVKSSLC